MRQKRPLAQLFAASLIAALFFLAVASARSQTNESSAGSYADLLIKLDDRGVAEISGSTNKGLFQGLSKEGDTLRGFSEDLTSKKGKYWIFQIQTERIDTFIVKIVLPENSVVNHIRGKGHLGIESNKGLTVLTFVGENAPINVTVQYRIQIAGKKDALNLLTILSALVILGSGIVVSKKMSRRRKEKGLSEEGESRKARDENAAGRKEKAKEDVSRNSEEPVPEPDSDKIRAMLPALSPAQRKIIRVLESRGGRCSQSAIRKETMLPKSSISRNIKSLEGKGIIRKASHGMTNIVELSEGYMRNQERSSANRNTTERSSAKD